MSSRSMYLAIIALVGLSGSVSASGGNPNLGKLVFAKCAACHSVEAGKNKIGPTLAGVIGRKAGTVVGFNYSPAMKASSLTWSGQVIDKYLTSPRALVQGNKMIFPGLSNAVDRANIIAFLQNPSAAK